MTELNTLNIELDGKNYTIKFYANDNTSNKTNNELTDEQKNSIINNYKNIIWNKYIELANNIIKGKYGNGEARKRAIEQAGFDYDFAQLIVNSMLGGK